MNGARNQLFAGAALAGNKYRSARVFQARDHAQYVLNFGGRADDAMKVGFSIYTLAEKLVLFYQVDFFGHPTQEQTQFFQRRKWFADVVVGTQFHRLHSGFNRTVAGHDGDLAARQKLFHFFQKLNARHVRHNHVGENHVRGLLFEQGQRGFTAIGFHAGIAQRLTHGHTKTTDALLVVNNQQADS